MDLNESIYNISDIIEGFIDDRTYMRYCFDNILFQFDGKAMSYMDYKKEVGGVSKTNDTKLSDIEKENIRNNALETLSSLALVN